MSTSAKSFDPERHSFGRRAGTTKFALVAATVLALSFSAAAASPTRWGATPAGAENDILADSIEWYDEEAGWYTDDVVYVECYGIRYQGFVQNGRRYFRHLRCYVEVTEDEPYWVKYHTTGRHSYKIEFVSYA